MLWPKRDWEEIAEPREGGLTLQYITLPQLRSPHPWERRRRGWKRQRGGLRGPDSWRIWEGLCHCHQPDSWPRWLWRPGNLLWGRSQSGESSTLPWEAKPLSKEFLKAGKDEEDQEVPAWNSCSLGDPAVPKEHQAPYQETPLLTASPWYSPSSGQNWSVLPREHHYMPAGSCRSICGQSHGRCQPLCHTCRNGWQLCPKIFS